SFLLGATDWILLFSACHGARPPLHTFPTRRSSDLDVLALFRVVGEPQQRLGVLGVTQNHHVAGPSRNYVLQVIALHLRRPLAQYDACRRVTQAFGTRQEQRRHFADTAGSDQLLFERRRVFVDRRRQFDGAFESRNGFVTLVQLQQVAGGTRQQLRLFFVVRSQSLLFVGSVRCLLPSFGVNEVVFRACPQRHVAKLRRALCKRFAPFPRLPLSRTEVAELDVQVAFGRDVIDRRHVRRQCIGGQIRPLCGLEEAHGFAERIFVAWRQAGYALPSVAGSGSVFAVFPVHPREIAEDG